jgi:hypothetical protein
MARLERVTMDVGQARKRGAQADGVSGRYIGVDAGDPAFGQRQPHAARPAVGQQRALAPHHRRSRAPMGLGEILSFGHWTSLIVRKYVYTY